MEKFDLQMTMEELLLDGEINLGKCSKSTAYKDTKRINEYLRENNYNVRAKLIIDKKAFLPYSITIIEAEEET